MPCNSAGCVDHAAARNRGAVLELLASRNCGFGINSRSPGYQGNPMLVAASARLADIFGDAGKHTAIDMRNQGARKPAPIALQRICRFGPCDLRQSRWLVDSAACLSHP